MRYSAPIPGQPSAARKGMILIVVLVVTVILSLAAYQYSDLMMSHYKEAGSFTRAAQARAFADAGVHYAAAALATPDNVTAYLNGNPFHCTAAFQGHQVQGGGGGPNGSFSIISAVDPDDANGAAGSFRYGVTDEGGKINLNTVMKLDPTGKVLHDLLMKLPNMTEDVADAIVDWLDPDDQPRANGAESDYYSGLSPSYQCKNGPLDSLEELLLVRGVTSQLLFGDDANRNGIVDPQEDNGNGLGWSAYLTIYSRELNLDAQNKARVYVNDTSLQTLYTNLTSAVGAELAGYIMAYRMYGPATLPAAGNTGGNTGTNQTGASPKVRSGTPPLPDLSQKPKGTLKSVYDLMNTYVSVPASNPKDPKEQPTYYASPLNNASQLQTLLPQLLDKLTTSRSQDIFGRINVNTASRTVLLALPGLTSADVDSIVSARPSPAAEGAPDPAFQTPAWLITNANVKAATLKALEKYVTARSQVYRMQVVGYLDATNGPFARLEVVVDSNGGQSRIVYVRPLTELGKGFDLTQNNP